MKMLPGKYHEFCNIVLHLLQLSIAVRGFKASFFLYFHYNNIFIYALMLYLLTLLHSEQPKLHRVLAVLSTKGLSLREIFTKLTEHGQ